jgi:hypothetical protein
MTEWSLTGHLEHVDAPQPRLHVTIAFAISPGHECAIGSATKGRPRVTGGRAVVSERLSRVAYN